MVEGQEWAENGRIVQVHTEANSEGGPQILEIWYVALESNEAALEWVSNSTFISSDNSIEIIGTLTGDQLKALELTRGNGKRPPLT